MSTTTISNGDYSLIHSIDQTSPTDITTLTPNLPATQNPNITNPQIITTWPPNNITLNPLLPKTTIATLSSPHIGPYIHLSALVCAHATLKDPLCTAFELEKSPGLYPDLETLHLNPSYITARYNASVLRLQTKLNSGSIMIEAADFAATACWTPTPPRPSAAFIAEMDIKRPVFAEFLRESEALKAMYLYPVSARYWHLSLMARDPRREYVPGAVRAVVDPFLGIAEAEGVPVWLEAGCERARDVYVHFGFRVVGLVVVGGGVETWCMIKP